MTTRDERGEALNLTRADRIGYAAAGTVLLISGLRNFGILRALLGGTLLYQAYTGYNPLFAPLDIHVNPDPPEGAGRETIVVNETITVAAPSQEIYGFWRNLENLPRFMRRLESVQVFDPRHSHWRAKGPRDTLLEWDSEIVEDIPGSLLRWRTLPGSALMHFGIVRFIGAPQGTIVEVEMQYVPPVGAFGTAIARLTGEEPRAQMREALRNLKLLFESGVIPPTRAPGAQPQPAPPVMP